MQKRTDGGKKDSAARLKEEREVRKKKKEKEKKIRKFLKFNKIKAAVFAAVFAIALVFQGFFDPSLCLNLICSPKIFGAIYYVFWVVDLANIALLNILPAVSLIGFVWKTLFYLLQVIYWYFIACLLAVLINKARARIWKHIGKKRRHEEEILKERLKRDLEKAQKLEREKLGKIGSAI